MPKIRRFTSSEQWNYGERAARLGSSDNRILRGIVDPQNAGVIYWSLWVQILAHRTILVVSIQTTELFDYQGSNFDPRGF